MFSSPAPRTLRNGQRGYTLLELMVVLSILTIFVAVSFPVMLKPLRKSHVQQAAQNVAEALMTARVWAMERGEIYAFQYSLGGSAYELKPLADLQPTTNKDANLPEIMPDSSVTDDPDLLAAHVGLNDDKNVDDQSQLTRFAAQLPSRQEEIENGVRFADVAALLDDSSNARLGVDRPQPELPAAQPSRISGSQADEIEDPKLVRPINWSEPILFYPDGRTQNESIKLVGEDGFDVDVQLRGLTGSVVVGQIQSPPTATDSSESGELLRDTRPTEMRTTLER